MFIFTVQITINNNSKVIQGLISQRWLWGWGWTLGNINAQASKNFKQLLIKVRVQASHFDPYPERVSSGTEGDQITLHINQK